MVNIKEVQCRPVGSRRVRYFGYPEAHTCPHNPDHLRWILSKTTRHLNMRLPVEKLRVLGCRRDPQKPMKSNCYLPGAALIGDLNRTSRISGSAQLTFAVVLQLEAQETIRSGPQG